MAKVFWIAFASLLVFAAIQPTAQAQEARNAAKIEKLQLRLLQAEAERTRWQRVIDTQQELARDPEKFSKAAREASRSLKASGTDLVYEGITGGLSGYLGMQSLLAEGNGSEKAKRAYKLAADGVDAAWVLLVKDHIASGDAEGLKPSEDVNRSIDKGKAILVTVADSLTDPALKEAMGGAAQVYAASFQFLNAYAVNDEPGMSKYLPALGSMLQGTLNLVHGLATNDEVAEAMLTGNQLQLAALNIGIGAYGLARGFELGRDADAIREHQMEAAVRLQRLLPRARSEVARAEAAESRIRMQIAALGGAPPPLSRTVQPSKQYADNFLSGPQAGAQVFDIVAAMDDRSGLGKGITPQAIARLADTFRRKSDDDLARREAEARARREAEEARQRAARIAERQARWADDERRSGYGRVGGGGGGSSNMDGVRERVYGAENRILGELNRAR